MRQAIFRCLALTIAAITVHAADGPQKPAPAEWPTLAALAAKAKPGEYLTFKTVIKAGAQEQSAHTYFWWDPADTELQLTQFIAQQADAPKEPPTDGKPPQVTTAKPQLDPNAPFQKAAAPNGLKVEYDAVTGRPFENLEVGGRRYSGTRYDHDIRATMPDGNPLAITNTIWVSPDAPLLGIVKVHQYVVGPMTMTSTMSLIWSSSHADLAAADAAATAAAEAAKAQAEAEATAKATVAAGHADAYLAVSRAAAADAWPLDDLSKIGYDARQTAQSYLLNLGYFYLDTDQVDQAQAVYRQLAGAAAFQTALRDRLRVVAAMANDREAMQALGVDEAQLDFQMAWKRFDYMKTNWMDYPSAVVLADIQAIKNDRVRLNIAHQAVLSPVSWSAQEFRTLLDMFPAEKQLEIVRGAAWSLSNSGNVAQFERNAEAVKAYKQDPSYWPYRLKTQAHYPDEPPAPSQVDAMLKQPDLDPKLALDVLTMLKDPRAENYRLPAAVAAEKQVRAQVVQAQEENRLNVDHIIRLAHAVAGTGDGEGAFELISTHLKDPSTRHQAPAVIALYESGKTADAITWRDDLLLSTWEKANSPEIWKQVAIAEITVGFAKAELERGNRDAARAQLQTAAQAALSANQRLIAHNQALPKDAKKIFWQSDRGYGIPEAPHTRVINAMIQTEDYQPALRFTMALQDEMPASGGTRKSWEALQDGLIGAGQWQVLGASLIAMPKDWERNWHRNRLAIGGQALGEIGQQTLIQELGDELQDLSDTTYFYRAAVIGAAVKGHQDTALEIMRRLTWAKNDGGSGSDETFGILAIAYGYLLADDPQSAYEWYYRRSGSIREHMARWEFNGDSSTGFLQKMGKELASLTSDPDTVNKWLAQFKSQDERAFFALGLAQGATEAEQAKAE